MGVPARVEEVILVGKQHENTPRKKPRKDLSPAEAAVIITALAGVLQGLAALITALN